MMERLITNFSRRNFPLILLQSSSKRFVGNVDVKSQFEPANLNKENETISPDFINRNPRNMEILGVARKREGWQFQFPRRDFYHKLIFNASNRNTTASVVHTSGKVVVSASTTEWAIRKHLYSSTDVAASLNIGRVLAHRCLKAGISEMLFDEEETPLAGEKVSKFYQAVIDGGVSLEEIEYQPAEEKIGMDYENLPKQPKIKEFRKPNPGTRRPGKSKYLKISDKNMI
ncbi:large ribosomal subunit protein uL18m-like [Tubulanus polymorphus]|uniref:large ribosomal subunit protein uL18m-like n=1 Tax=Tubulanus polymorphus TaxID=672921 RepID=UPI003DA628E9